MLALLLAFVLTELPESSALVQRLPIDGTWVTFDIVVESGGAERRAEWKLQSVGTYDLAGTPCRFIEMVLTPDQDPPMPATLRMLIPEREFGIGKNPLAKLKRGWGKSSDGSIQEFVDLYTAETLVAHLQQGPIDNREQLAETERVDWQRGRLEVKPVTGTSDMDIRGIKQRIMHRVLWDAEVPFGLAGAQQRISLASRPDVPFTTITIRLKDSGVDAKPNCPELVP